MKTNRRSFIKTAGVAGTAILSTGGFASCRSEKMQFEETLNAVTKKHTQIFNMCGYGAPKLEKVRIGFIGLGNRGPSSLRRLILLEGVEIKALCEIRKERLALGEKILKDAGLPEVATYGDSEDAWKQMCQRDDIDLIYQVTPWRLHTPVSVYAMEHGKHAASEMPAALTIDDCWKLVETSEQTRRHFMMLENCCYDFFELMVLNMVRQGYFGDIIHADAGYLHDQTEISFSKTQYPNMWLLRESQTRNGNHYPTHGLGPVCQVMDINRGDRLEYMTSTQSNDFCWGKKAAELAKTDSFYKEFDTNSFRGNMNTSVIRTAKGKTIMLQHDVTSPRPYSRLYMVSGTKAVAQKYPLPGKIATGETWFAEEQMQELNEKYTPEIVKRIGEMAKKVGGHGGMDFMMDWHLIDCLRNGLPLDQDVYDAAVWSSIVPLSEWSVSNGSGPIQIPDFTCGSYHKNIPVDITLSKGGNTGVRMIRENETENQQKV
ncbi:MAG TPA: acetylgalactosaminidase [Bacteroidales bacterium]|nr:acetylgalactosaminidase [Bacteroidales bacterium]